MLDVVVSSRNDDGYIIHKLDDGQAKSYAAVRGGLSWPVGNRPAYICVFGQVYYERQMWRDTVRGPIRMIAEHEISATRPLSDLYGRIMDLAKTLWCEEWFCRMPYSEKEDDAYYQGFIEYMGEQGYERPFPYITEAPFWDNFLWGYQTVLDWHKQGLLTVPEGTKVAGEMLKIRDVDLGDRPENKFNAVNGLRYVVGAFQRMPPISAKFASAGIFKPEIPAFYYQT